MAGGGLAALIASKGTAGIVVYHVVHYTCWVVLFTVCWLLNIDGAPLVEVVKSVTGFDFVVTTDQGRIASAWLATLVLVKLVVPFKLWATVKLLPAAEGPLSRLWQRLRRIPTTRDE